MGRAGPVGLAIGAEVRLKFLASSLRGPNDQPPF